MLSPSDSFFFPALCWLWVVNQPRHNSPILVLHSKQLLSFIRGIFMNNSLDYPFEAIRCQSEVAQSCLTLCDPMDCSPPGSFVHEDSPGKNTGVELPFPPPGYLPNPGIKPRTPTLQVDSLPSEPPGKARGVRKSQTQLSNWTTRTWMGASFPTEQF